MADDLLGEETRRLLRQFPSQMTVTLDKPLVAGLIEERNAARAERAAAVARVAELTAAIRRIHVPIPEDPGFCSACTTSWPCETARLAAAAPSTPAPETPFSAATRSDTLTDAEIAAAAPESGDVL